MLKKPLVVIGLLSALLIIAGLILSPSFVGKFTSDGMLKGVWSIIGVGLFQYFIIILGAVILLETIIISYLPGEKRGRYYILSVCAIGIVITIMGIILNPWFVEEKLNLIGRLDIDNYGSLYNFQLSIITFGCLLILISLLFYSRKFLKNAKKFTLILLTLILVVYTLLLYTCYIDIKYPSNILLKLNTFDKVSDLVLGKDILLSDFDPQPTIKVNNREILKAKYPVIDMHFGFYSDFITEEDRRVIAPEALIKSMDSLGIKMIVGLDGKEIEKLLDQYQKRFPDRFLNFYNILMGSSRIFTDEFISSLPAKLEKYAEMGVRGIGEFPKDLGLKLRDSSGKLLAIDDPRLDPLYAKAGELGIPIIWHAADPSAFFKPVDRYNERYNELRKYSQWSYSNPGFPTKDSILKQKENVIKKHPNTIFIGAHMSWLTDDLTKLGELLDAYPNFYVEFGTTLSEIGRQPFTTRKFFIKYQDKILFGTDGGSLFNVDGWTVERFFRSHFEFLETENEYIEYPMQGAINQGNWRIYGINLPDEVLEKIYYKNAEKLLFNEE